MQSTQVGTIEGKVAKVLNKRELVINRGAEHGVENGMRFEVVDDFDPILDPDTGETLGTIKRVKIRVRVSYVQPRFSIARTYETYQVSEPSSMLSLDLRKITKVKTISEYDDDFPSTAYERAQSFVGVGDKVVQMDLD